MSSWVDTEATAAVEPIDGHWPRRPMTDSHTTLSTVQQAVAHCNLHLGSMFTYGLMTLHWQLEPFDNDKIITTIIIILFSLLIIDKPQWLNNEHSSCHAGQRNSIHSYEHRLKRGVNAQHNAQTMIVDFLNADSAPDGCQPTDFVESSPVSCYHPHPPYDDNDNSSNIKLIKIIIICKTKLLQILCNNSIKIAEYSRESEQLIHKLKVLIC